MRVLQILLIIIMVVWLLASGFLLLIVPSQMAAAEKKQEAVASVKASVFNLSTYVRSHWALVPLGAAVVAFGIALIRADEEKPSSRRFRLGLVGVLGALAVLSVVGFVMQTSRANDTSFVRRYLERNADLIVSLNKAGSRTATMWFADGPGTLRIFVTAETPDDFTRIDKKLNALVVPNGVTWELKCDNTTRVYSAD